MRQGRLPLKSTIWLPPTRTRGPRQLSRSPTRLRSTRPPTPSPPPMWPRTWRKTRRKRLDLMRSRQTLLDASAKYRSVRKPLRSRHFRQFCRSNKDSHRRDSNPKPAVYKTAALPIELRQPVDVHMTMQCRTVPIGQQACQETFRSPILVKVIDIACNGCLGPLF